MTYQFNIYGIKSHPNGPDEWALIGNYLDINEAHTVCQRLNALLDSGGDEMDFYFVEVDTD